MRKVLLMAFMLLMMTTGAALAEANKTAVKIGVIDMQLVGTESEFAKDARKKMDAKYGAEKEELEKQAKTLQTKGEALQKKPTEAKQVEFVKLKRAFDEKNYTFSRNVQQDEVKIRQDMVTLAFQAAAEIAQAKGITFVVDAAAGGVMYADESMNLTQEVLEAVDKLWKAGALKEGK